jgi:hypothetical protein
MSRAAFAEAEVYMGRLPNVYEYNGDEKRTEVDTLVKTGAKDGLSLVGTPSKSTSYAFLLVAVTSAGYRRRQMMCTSTARDGV